MIVSHTSLTAWAVLDDAEHAIGHFEKASDEQDYRIYWWAVMSLLRATGHVLDKVDGKADPVFGKIQNAWWYREGKDDPIIVGFVENGRNELLKRYTLQAGPSVVVTTGGIPITTRGGAPLVTRQWFLSVGPFAGSQASNIARQALVWWRSKLIALVADHRRSAVST